MEYTHKKLFIAVSIAAPLIFVIGFFILLFGVLSLFNWVFALVLLFLVVAEGFLLAICAYYTFKYITDGKFRKEVSEETYRTYRKYFFVFGNKNYEFEQLPGEKILFPATPYYSKQVGTLGSAIPARGFSAREFIITNKRIIPAATIATAFYLNLSFGSFNLWKNGINVKTLPQKIKEKEGTIGGNANIEKIEYGKNDVGEYVKITTNIEKGIVKINGMYIYTDKAKQIYKLFA